MKVRGNSLIGLTLTLSLVVALCVAGVASDRKYDDSTPLEEVKAAASGGEADAMLEYGSRLVMGVGVDTNTPEGLDWLQKAADAGSAEAWYAIGFVYSNAVGVELDIPKSVEYYRKGAEAGDADCQTAMGLLYQAGDRVPSGVEADPAEAVKWYQMAAEQDHTEAIQHLAMMNVKGLGIEQDDAEALRWFRKGAELGNADCMWGLGRYHLHGAGIQQDSVTAYALFTASLDGVENPDQRKAMTVRRDQLGELLSDEQREKAQPIIEEWAAKVKK